MNFEEHAAKPLLAAAGIAVPESQLAYDLDGVAAAAERIGRSVVKAQVPTGKRGKAGGIQLADSAGDAVKHAAGILGMEIEGYKVEKLLVEAQVPFARELYAAVLTDSASWGPKLLFSTMGGMDVEEVAARDPDAMKQLTVDIRAGLERGAIDAMLKTTDLGPAAAAVADVLEKLYAAYRRYDAELLEINPLVLTEDGAVIALDCKLTIDDSSAARQSDVANLATPDKATALEAEAQAAGLKYIELGGAVGVLANGAGLTMTTMDAISHFGGRPANFLEVGGEAYTKSKTALSMLLKNPNIKSLLVNFCGAFARCDVMAEGVVNAWKELDPPIPVFFTIHGTGEDEAVALVRRELGVEPFDRMDDAVKAAVEAAA